MVSTPTFPPELHITVFDNDSRQGISGIALKLTLFARRKNDYTIPMVTNSGGEVHLSAEYVRQSIKDDWELFPMDYESTLEECSKDVEIKVCTPEDIQRTILAMKMFRSASTISDELIEAFENSANEQYIPLTARFNVENNNKITIGIYSRLRPSGKSKKPTQ
jgi:hypothetical protein